MNLLLWIILGSIVGITTHFIDPNPSISGFINTIVMGILGSVLGGLSASLLLGVDLNFINIGSSIIAVLESLLVLFLYKNLRKREI